jgi:hypothetical protein
VNFNNVNLDSLQSFLSSQNNLLYLSQSSSSSSTTTTITTTTTTTSNINHNNDSEQHQISIRPKPSHQELVSVLPKVKNEHLEYLSRQLSSSSNSETTNLLDNDLNHKQPRPIRPKPSSRSNSLQVKILIYSSRTKP